MSISSPIDLGLPGTPLLPDEVNEALREEIGRIYNAIRTLQERLGAYAGLDVLDPNNFIAANATFAESLQVHRMQAILVEASANVSAGRFGNLHNVAGTLRCRHALASSISTRAHGWFPSAISIGDVGIMFLNSGYNTAGGLTVAATYYLSAATPGGITTIAPVAVGTIVQEVGVALSATELATCIELNPKIN